MDERRKSKRLPVDIRLFIEFLYKQDHIKLDNINEDIVVTNISKTGIGFVCNHDLPLGFYFNAKIVIDDEKFFYSVVKIVRKEDWPEGPYIGCEFVGLADVLSGCIDEYEKELV